MPRARPFRPSPSVPASHPSGTPFPPRLLLLEELHDALEMRLAVVRRAQHRVGEQLVVRRHQLGRRRDLVARVVLDAVQHDQRRLARDQAERLAEARICGRFTSKSASRHRCARAPTSMPPARLVAPRVDRDVDRLQAVARMRDDDAQRARGPCQCARDDQACLRRERRGHHQVRRVGGFHAHDAGRLREQCIGGLGGFVASGR